MINLQPLAQASPVSDSSYLDARLQQSQNMSSSQSPQQNYPNQWYQATPPGEQNQILGPGPPKGTKSPSMGIIAIFKFLIT